MDMPDRSIVMCSTALAVLTALVGCGEAEPTPAPDEPEAPESPGFDEVERVALMEGHYTSAIAAHDALIRNDLLGWQALVAELAARELPADTPANWRTPHQRMHDAASRAANASSLELAGPVMGAVVEACGSCHTNLGAGPVYRRPLAPEGETEVETEMLGHQWATERLWEGVTGPREEAWHRGAAALAAGRVFADRAGEVVPGLLERETALRSAGQSAMAISGLHARADAYGTMLATCAACHQQAGVTFDAADN